MVHKRDSLIVILIVGLSLLAAGSLSGSAQTTVTLGFWDWGTEGPALMQRLIADFNASQSAIVVEADPIPGNIRETVLLRFAGGTAPDVVWWYGPWYPGMVEAGGFLDLTPYIEREFTGELDDFYAPYLEPMRWKGRLYGLSQSGQASVLYYNKDHFAAAGLANPTDAWTWDDMLAAARQLTVRDGTTVNRYGLAAFFGPWEGSHTLNVIWSNGGALFDRFELPTASRATSESVVESIEWVADLLFEHGVVPPREYYSTNDFLVGEPVFIQGDASMTIAHRGPIAALRQTAIFDWDVAPLPLGRSGERSNFLQSVGYSILSTSEAPDAAWEVLKYLVSREVMEISVAGGGALPTRISAAPAVLADVPPGNAQAFLTAMTVGYPGTARAVNQERLDQLFYEALDTVITGASSARGAMEQLHPLLTAELDAP